MWNTASAFLLALPLTMCCAQPEQTAQYALESAESEQVICTDIQMREKVRAIMFKALDSALEAHIEQTFAVWMKDARDQPERARNGVRNGVLAYVRATKSAELWSPMSCPT